MVTVCVDAGADGRGPRPGGVPVKVCSIDGCPKAVKSRGLCPMHLNRLYRHGDPTVVARPAPPRLCSVDACDRDATQRGWCNAHYQRWAKHGDVFADVPVTADGRAMKVARGVWEPEPDVETCVDCDLPAWGGTVRCQRHLFADLRRRSARKPFGQSSAKPSEHRPGVRQVRTFAYGGRQGAA